jgi:hypothetical protein
MMIRGNDELMKKLVRDLKSADEVAAIEHLRTLTDAELVGLIRFDMGGWPYDFCMTAIPLRKLANHVFLVRKMHEVDNAQG